MRKIIFLLIWYVGFVSAQEVKISESTTEVSVVFDSDCSKEIKFDNAKEWVAKSFGDYKTVVQYEDKEKCKIIVKGVSPLLKEETNAAEGILQVNETPFLRFTLTIECKDSKHRLLFDGISISVEQVSKVLFDEETTTTDYDIKNFCNRIIGGETTIVDIDKYEDGLSKDKNNLHTLLSIDKTNLKNKEIKKIEKEISTLETTIKHKEKSIEEHYFWTNKEKRRLKNIEDVINALIASFNKEICKKEDW